MRILFMGTPDIAAHCLEALYGAGHTLCGVFTRQDKPVGRKQVLTAPPVKQVAMAHGTPVFPPVTLRMTTRVPTVSAAPKIRQITAFWTKPATMKLTKLTPATVMA